MGYGFESTDFTCDGYQFYAQFVQPGSDGDVRSYLTIYVYDENGNLSVTNINGLTVGTCLYGQLEDGSLDWLGNYKIKLSDCLSWNGDTITINRNIAKYNDSSLTHGVVTSDSTTYTYDAATNTFVATNGTNKEAMTARPTTVLQAMLLLQKTPPAHRRPATQPPFQRLQ